jgi:hypothetical protein
MLLVRAADGHCRAARLEDPRQSAREAYKDAVAGVLALNAPRDAPRERPHVPGMDSQSLGGFNESYFDCSQPRSLTGLEDALQSHSSQMSEAEGSPSVYVPRFAY